MSGIYIKDMEMPKSCSECKFFAWKRRVGNHCAIDESITFHATLDGLDVRYEKNGNCQFIAVPDHGRLIDADALLERFEKEEKAADEHGRDFSFSFKSGGENCTEWWPVQQMLMGAPTIIPADKEGEV